MTAKNICALDLGTTKFCLATISASPRSPHNSIKTVSVAAKGMERGMLCNFDEAQEALATLVDTADREFTNYSNAVVVGVSGCHLKSRFIEIEHHIPDNTYICSDLINRVEEITKKKFRTNLTEVIHCIPVTFIIDQREPVSNPIGFTGKILKVKIFIVEADKYYLNDIVRICNRSGLEVKRLYAEPLASSSVITNYQDKLSGSIVADIGGGSTDGMVFYNGTPISLFNINIGGESVTRDLSICLNLSHEESERLKIICGINGTSIQTKIEVRDLNNNLIKIDNKLIQKIIHARINELIDLIGKELSSYTNLIRKGLYITGGGSDLVGIDKCFSNAFRFPVRKIQPSMPSDLEMAEAGSILLNGANFIPAKYATVSGLLYLEALELKKLSPQNKNGVVRNSFNQFIDWIKELA